MSKLDLRVRRMLEIRTCPARKVILTTALKTPLPSVHVAGRMTFWRTAGGVARCEAHFADAVRSELRPLPDARLPETLYEEAMADRSTESEAIFHLPSS